MMIKMRKAGIIDYILLLFIFLSLIFSLGVSLLIAILMAFFMLLSIRLFRNILVNLLTGLAQWEVKILGHGKMRKAILLKEEYIEIPESIWDYINISKIPFVLMLGVTLLLTRIFNAQVGPIGELGLLQAYILSWLISIIISGLIASLSLPYWIIFGSRARYINFNNGTVSHTGILLNKIKTAIFGYGSLVILLWIYLDILSKSSYNISTALGIFLTYVSITIGSLALGSLIFSYIYWRRSREDLIKIYNRYETFVEKISIPKDELLEKLAIMFDISLEKPKEETEDVEVSEE